MTIFSNTKARAREGAIRLHKRAFTLVELMFAAGILAVVVSIVTPTFIAFSKYTVTLGNYSDMSYDSRMAVEILSRDIRAANLLTTANASSVTLEMPADLGGHTVGYSYNGVESVLYRTVTDSSGTTDRQEMLEDLQRFEFIFYNRLGNESTAASRLTETKSINIDALMVRSVVEQSNTDYIISAKFMMRNAN